MKHRSATKSRTLFLVRITYLVVLLAAAGLGSQSLATADASSQFSVTLRQITASGRLSDLRWPDFSDYRVHVANFYDAAGYDPAWLRNHEPTQQAQTFIEVLKQADSKGLNAEDYDGSRWADRLSRLHQSPSQEDQARFDAALTVCAMRYISDLHIGRVNPQHFKFNLDVAPKKYDLPLFVREKLINGADVRAELDHVEPPFAGYKRTERALQQYMELSRQDDGEQLPIPAKPVEPGSSYDGIPRLTRLLSLLGDLPDSAPPENSNLYAGALVTAVKHFQERHGLSPDGRLGTQTLKQLNVPSKSSGRTVASDSGALALGPVRFPSTTDRRQHPRVSLANVRQGRHNRAHDERDRGQGLSPRDSGLRARYEVRGVPSVLERAAEHSAL